MFALEECHAQGFLRRVFGQCNEAKRNLNKCLREARLARTRENHEKAKERNAKVQDAWKEIDSNS
jgi:COX assembly protein 2